ncbi:MAG: DMT family transporter [Clostridiales bacterium]|jgi:RarD protein|nr:DMT family transporter [Clostridiales bacterium]
MTEKIYFIISMIIFGSIGLIIKGIPLSSAQIAMIRGVIGSIFLIIAALVMKKKPSFKEIKKNLIFLIASGAALGFNWILLFEAYKNTTITNATLSYYFAPVIVVFLSPLILKEKLTFRKLLSILAAIIGMFLVAWTGGDGSLASNELVGIGFGLSAAFLYALVVILNKLIKNMGGLDTTIIQLTIASLILIPYVLLQGAVPFNLLDTSAIVKLALVGLINTGLAYLLYFSSVQKLGSQTVAILSYIDPISALVMSAIFIGERITGLQLLGGLLILGGAFVSGREKR